MGTLLNRRRYMGGGASLPYDAEIEYLESDGASYIDTGITMRQLVVADYKLRFTSVSGIQVFFGVCTNNTNAARAQVYINGSTWKDVDTNNLKTIYTPSNSATTTLDFTLRSMTKAVKNNDWTLFVFARNSDDTTPLPTKMRLYYLRMTFGGVLVRDYIPVRVGTIGYLYDKISGQLFGNSGTGNFILGPDKAPESYDAEIEYLESTGTQYIDTEINCGLSTSLIVDGNYTEFMNDENFGSIVTSGGHKRFHFGLYNGKFIFGVGNQINDNIAQDLDRHLFELNGVGYAKFDNTQITLATYESTYKRVPLYLFARNTDNIASTFSKFKLYGCRIIENDIVVRDYIPVRAGTVGYMYDKIEKKLYVNYGTGSFILGPDKT